MSWNLDSSRPIYAQIIEKVSLDIVSGKYFRIRKREPGSFRKNKRAIYYRGQSYD